MSVLKVFTDAATGVFSPQTVAPAPATPRVQNDPRPPVKKNEDAATISLSSAAREFAATAKDAPIKSENAPAISSSEITAQNEVESSTNLEQVAAQEEQSGAEQNSGESSTEQEQSGQFTAEEERTIRELQARDREVRAHEQAHLNSLGQYRSGGASYTYTTGPDGKQYATSGEVPVNISPESTPEQTITKAQTVRRAALAPAEPSGADRAAAASASQLEAQARAELNAERSESEPKVESAEPSETEPNTEPNTEPRTTAPDQSDAEFYSGRLVGASQQAFQSSIRYSSASSDRGSLLDLQA